jgi:CBS domain-containing protein
MRVSEVLRRKGASVVTIAPDRTVREMLALLAEHGIGAVVVTADGAQLDGVVSERDIVRALDAEGDGVLDGPVSAIMTAEIRTCGRDTAVEELMVVMTEQRIRHVPVIDDGRLAGIVSIGDVVKQRISEISDERDQLSAYITGSYITGRTQSG